LSNTRNKSNKQKAGGQGLKKNQKKKVIHFFLSNCPTCALFSYNPTIISGAIKINLAVFRHQKVKKVKRKPGFSPGRNKTNCVTERKDSVLSIYSCCKSTSNPFLWQQWIRTRLSPHQK
jgi:hypothetical protein